MRFIFTMLFVSQFTFLIASNDSISTRNEYQSKGYFISLVPHYLFRSGLRIEFDKSIYGNKHWITIAPSLYYREGNGLWLFGDSKSYSLSGGGIDIHYRWYQNNNNAENRFYLSAGAGYRYTKQEHKGYTWDTYIEDGLTYYRYINGSWFEGNSTFLLKLMVGKQHFPYKFFTFDYYIGPGIKITQHILPAGQQETYEDEMFSFGYSGIYIVGGIRLSFGW